MPQPYTIEPPPDRQRELTRDRKLDRIIDLLSPKPTDEGGDDGSPEVTFEPEPDQLPTEDSLEPTEGEAGAEGQGEGTANVADGRDQRGGFRFPGAKRTGGMPR